GLALSSRNVRLSDEGKIQALALSKVLLDVSEKMKEETALYTDIKQDAISFLKNSDGLEVEYFEICDSETLQPVTSCNLSIKLIVLVAAWVEGVRLIDNMFVPEHGSQCKSLCS